jgi:hypothetical protein
VPSKLLAALCGLQLQVFWPLVEDLDGFMNPTPLPVGLPIALAECLPKAQRTISNR